MLNTPTNCSSVNEPGALRDLSVVVPCFNEEEALPETHLRLTRVCQLATNGRFEIIYVNDGSTDRTWEVIENLCRRDDTSRGINLSRNFGHQAALTAGLSVCGGARILIIDADLQDPPELLPAMMAEMNKGAEVVYGVRRRRSGESVFKRCSAALFYRILSALSDSPIPRDTGDFRLITARVLRAFLNMPESHRFVRGMISWIGYKQVPLYYDRAARHAGETKYTFRKMIHFAADAITSFSTRPLRLLAYLGIVILLFAFIGMLITVYAYLFLDTMPGWPSLMVVVLASTGAQLFGMGMLGEYLGRIYIQQKMRPLFLISDAVGFEVNQAPSMRGSDAAR